MNVSSSSSRQNPDPEASMKTLDQSFASLDADRASGYEGLNRARAAKSSSLAREQRLLALKHGGTTARIQYAAALLPLNEELRREVAATQEVLETTPPVVDENSFAVYGFVRRKDQTGIPGLTLGLTDDQGNWQRQYGYACTDERGYFLLRIERKASPKTEAETKREEELKKLEEQKRAEEARKAQAASGQKEASTAGAPAAGTAAERLSSGQRIQTNLSQYAAQRGLQLRVFNREGRVLHIEKRPVVPRADSLDYRLIILGDDACGCTPPPEKSDGKSDPKSPRTPPAPPPAPTTPAPGTQPQPRVASMKSYQNPAPPPRETGSTPLEAIRGIGPKRAAKMRAAGIDDVEEFTETPGAALVKIAGFDKTAPKAAEKKPAARPTSADKPAKASVRPAKEATPKKAASKPRKNPKG